ncbi:hypothetical protein [Roseofilum casamattae]|uniref:Peptidase n=1 Tax=Roseofilum casamattae BLCC-M143 TaxID=3022442 RepID=A0ABT7C3I6_9CYAN|nr:hypothetical protein [Roseofilum casamattae]MDJ1185900.1 peptidase [Roseofilum casamattae BLCC-M143]
MVRTRGLVLMDALRRLIFRWSAIAAAMLAVFYCALALANSTTLDGINLPEPRAHPLPPTLAQWHDPQEESDYFEAVKPTKAGYLVWSRFPVRVYLDTPDTGDSRWREAVMDAIAQWQPYLPIELGDRQDSADIIIHKKRPPLTLGPDGQLERVRAATTRYKLILVSTVNGERKEQYLSHRCEIFLTPNQSLEYTLATARHEIGHAIGIWGHSPEPTDVLYFAQVRNPPDISSRDINTLKRIYQQPTSLGWPVVTAIDGAD